MEHRRPAGREAARPDAVAPGLVSSVWLPFALAYFLAYGLRNVNAVLAPELTRELSLTAAQLGFLTSVFFITFAAVQLPAGMLLDRFGSRRVHGVLLLVAAVGSALHALGTGFVELVVGRALMGIGFSVALMSAAKAFAQWFPHSRVPLAINMIMAMGGLGAMMAAGPVGWSLEYVSWRFILGSAAGVLVAAAAFLFFAVPERAESVPRQSLRQLTAGVGTVFSNAGFLRLALTMGIVSSSHSAVQSLWIGPWLRDVGAMDRNGVMLMLTLFALASITGFALVGTIADTFIRRGMRALTLYKIQTTIGIVIFALAAFSEGTAGVVLWGLYFLIGGGGALVLGTLARRFPAHLMGRVNTGTNVVLFSLAFGFQWAIGAVLDLWPVVDGRYAAAGYHTAFAGMLVLQLIVYVVLVFFEKAPARTESSAAVGERSAKAAGERVR